MTTYYKVLDEQGRSCNGGNSQWSLPVKNADGTWTPGEWMPAVEGDLEPCENGYHLTDAEHLLNWANASLYTAEYRGEIIEGDGKVIVRQARLTRRVEGWNDRNLRLFAVWCARQALARVDNPDPRSIAACDVAERFANGEATKEELAAARDARDARAAAWDAASADSAAAWDAQSKKLLEMIGVTQAEVLPPAGARED